MADNAREPPASPPRISASTWIVLAVVCGSALLGLAILLPFSIPNVLGGRQAVVSEADRKVLVSATFLESYLDEFIFRSELETVSKTRYVNKRVVLESVYQEHSETPSRIACRVVHDPDVVRAAATFAEFARENEERAGQSDRAVERRDDLLRWGDESRYLIQTEAGQVVSAYFVARLRDRVFQVSCEGLHVDSRDFLAAVVRPCLEELKAYEP